MRYSLPLAIALLGLTGCVVRETAPPTTTTTYVTPAPTATYVAPAAPATTTYVTPSTVYSPPTSTTVIRTP